MFIGTMTRPQVEVELVATKAALRRVEQLDQGASPIPCQNGGAEGGVWLELHAKVAALEAALANKK